jgi:hypothetical protein
MPQTKHRNATKKTQRAELISKQDSVETKIRKQSVK